MNNARFLFLQLGMLCLALVPVLRGYPDATASGTATAGGASVNGTSTANPASPPPSQLDTDGDGLNDDDERNRTGSDPAVKNTDVPSDLDGTSDPTDAADGWPRVDWLKPARLADIRYAVVKLRTLGLESSVRVSQIDDKGNVLGFRPSSTVAYREDGVYFTLADGHTTPVPVMEDVGTFLYSAYYYGSPSINGYLSPQGVVLGTVMTDRDTQESGKAWQAATWTPNEGAGYTLINIQDPPAGYIGFLCSHGIMQTRAGNRLVGQEISNGYHCAWPEAVYHNDTMIYWYLQSTTLSGSSTGGIRGRLLNDSGVVAGETFAEGHDSTDDLSIADEPAVQEGTQVNRFNFKPLVLTDGVPAQNYPMVTIGVETASPSTAVHWAHRKAAGDWPSEALKAWNPLTQSMEDVKVASDNGQTSWVFANDQLEIVVDNRIIRNGVVRPLADLMPTGWTVPEFNGPQAINKNGVILANATPPNSPSSAQPEPVLLVPTDVVTINTFIPMNNLDNPWNNAPFTENTVFTGDNRHGGSPDRATWNEKGSHRTHIEFNVVAWQIADSDGLLDNAYANDPDGVKNDDYYVHIGTTYEFDKASSLDASGNLTAAARADTHLADGTLKIGEGTAPKSEVWLVKPIQRIGDKKVAITCRCESQNPLFSGAPAISYTIVITIDKTDIAAPKYSITGSHDGFPAYEIYINNKRVYQFDPLATGEGPASLWPDEEHDVNENSSHLNLPLP